MTDHPILFMPVMVEAMLREAVSRGKGKTVTRRLTVKKGGAPSQWAKVKPGDWMWVKETIDYAADIDAFLYQAPSPHTRVRPDGRMRLSEIAPAEKVRTLHQNTPISLLFMPRWASRLTLQVNTVETQFLQEITETQARQEGIIALRKNRYIISKMTGARKFWPSARAAYADLWNALHDFPQCRWEDNPLVFVISFTPFLANIDVIKPRHKTNSVRARQ